MTGIYYYRRRVVVVVVVRSGPFSFSRHRTRNGYEIPVNRFRLAVGSRGLGGLVSSAAPRRRRSRPRRRSRGPGPR